MSAGPRSGQEAAEQAKPALASTFDCAGVAELLSQLEARGVLQPIDLHLGRLLLRLTQTALSTSAEATSRQGLPALAGALASRAVQAGHVCLDLPHLLQTPLVDQDDHPVRVDWPELSEWRGALSASQLVDEEPRGASSALTSAGVGQNAQAPLLVDAQARVFLQRYHSYQERLVRQLNARASAGDPIDEAQLAQSLARYFPPLGDEFDAQRFAALLATRNKFTVISGGPGTGKTTTVGKLLLLLQEQALSGTGQALRILLLAPTGKAAQRLSESLTSSMEKLEPARELAQTMPQGASTIHRALGYRSHTPTRFVHDEQNPLSADVVVVDEASMVDLSLMTKLVEAVPKRARLVLLGDKDQLASVEAGAIFGDIFRAADQGATSHQLRELAARLGSPPPGSRSPSNHEPSEGGESPGGSSIADCTVHMTKSYRYDDDSGIGQLAAALRRGSPAAVVSALTDNPEARWTNTAGMSERALRAELRALIEDSLGEYARTKDPEQRLAQLDTFRLLSAHRKGALGVAELNRLAETTLMPHGLAPTEGAYEGCPIMVTQNDYQQQLFNGDIGVLGRLGQGQRLAAYFRSTDGLRRVQLSRLPMHETVFAMTVHKSQGSEFERVALVLPEHPSPVFTRELLYTGVTRARKQVLVYGPEDVLTAGVKTPVHRSSGLSDALRNGG